MKWDDILGCLGVLFLIGLAGSCIHWQVTCERETKTIQEIGGCDEDGYCGVTYTDGTFGIEAYPSKGETGRKCK